jgi:hypothetical protein
MIASDQRGRENFILVEPAHLIHDMQEYQFRIVGVGQECRGFEGLIGSGGKNVSKQHFINFHSMLHRSTCAKQ